MVKSLAGNHYTAAHMDDMTWEMKLYFLKEKRKTIISYKKDEVYIKTHTGHNIKY